MELRDPRRFEAYVHDRCGTNVRRGMRVWKEKKYEEKTRTSLEERQVRTAAAATKLKELLRRVGDEDTRYGFIVIGLMGLINLRTINGWIRIHTSPDLVVVKGTVKDTTLKHMNIRKNHCINSASPLILLRK
jgi:hypothetical protein